MNERDYYRYVNRARFYSVRNNPYNTYLNDSLQYVQELIRDSCASINVQENRANDAFRKEVLSSSIIVSNNMHILKILNEIESCKWEDVIKSRDAYIKTLVEIGVYDKKLREKIEKFFETFKNAYDDYQNQKEGIKIDLAWQYAEFLKIKSIAELAKKYEKIKDNIRRPRETFLGVINDFLLVVVQIKK